MRKGQTNKLVNTKQTKLDARSVVACSAGGGSWGPSGPKFRRLLLKWAVRLQGLGLRLPLSLGEGACSPSGQAARGRLGPSTRLRVSTEEDRDHEAGICRGSIAHSSVSAKTHVTWGTHTW